MIFITAVAKFVRSKKNIKSW